MYVVTLLSHFCRVEKCDNEINTSFVVVVAFAERKYDNKSKMADALGNLQDFQNLGASIPEGCANPLLDKISAENCIQMKEKLDREDCAHPYH